MREETFVLPSAAGGIRHEPSSASGYEIEQETLNMLLDGQKLLLDTKYGRVREKTKNVPIIAISNDLPPRYDTEAFKTRINFFSKCSPIDPGRLASTLFARCISFYRATLPKVAGICPLPPGMDHLSEEAKIALEERVGFKLNSLRSVSLPLGREEEGLGSVSLPLGREEGGLDGLDSFTKLGVFNIIEECDKRYVIEMSSKDRSDYYDYLSKKKDFF